MVHTGQHYDRELSEVFFDELGCRRRTTSSASARAATPTRPARMLQRHGPGACRRAAGPGAGLRRHQLDPGRRAGRGQAAATRSGTWRPGCARSTARCRRSTTGCSPTMLADLLLLPQPDGGRQPGRGGHHRGRPPGRRRDGGRGPALRPDRAAARRCTRGWGSAPAGYASSPCTGQSNTADAAMPALVDGAGGDRAGRSCCPLHPRTRIGAGARRAARRGAAAAATSPPPLGYLDFTALLASARGVPDRLRRRAEGGLPAPRAMHDAARHHRVGGDRRAWAGTGWSASTPTAVAAALAELDHPGLGIHRCTATATRPSGSQQ